MLGRGQVNDWWGSNDSKWRLLADQGGRSGYYPEELPSLTGNAERAAYERKTRAERRAKLDQGRETIQRIYG